MSHKPDKAARRKAKLKAKRVHAEQLRHQQHVRIAAALTDLCADVLPKYVDDSKGPDLVGRNILWRMGMVAWNVAITGRKEIDDSSIDEMRVDAESKKMVREKSTALFAENTRNTRSSGLPSRMWLRSLSPEVRN